MVEDFDKLDEMYRVTEKKEIKKYQEVGKTSRQFYDD